MPQAPRSIFGGDKRLRTDDLLLAKQALSQLSYVPINDRSGFFLVGDLPLLVEFVADCFGCMSTTVGDTTSTV